MIFNLTCFVLRVILRLLFRCRLYGIENIPRDSSFILVSNHVSYIDPFAVGVFVPRKLTFLAKKELYRNRLMNWYMRALRTIPIDRESLSVSSVKEVIATVKKGYPIGIFPEGARSDGPGLREPQAGAAYFALKCDIPVVAGYVKGTDKVLPRGRRFPRISPISVYYGSPKRYQMSEGGGKEESYRQVSYKIMDQIKELKERHD